ncbi:predicted protein [Naegleria gruberi]|uniref:Predicted protein n=1 Tax=Naegleria gruberi TaxID=5762 RepID=D2V3G2_NAEGR|nr:uncharacterized protein NAEGRDRAFT_63351 [Naegleria gruberi]EFC48632.1 predicted protein [Naegleria gruberi]|eukprot:XP_002681376.1 predicted protein [Naegleria gruberi strain NEG-M]
MNREKYIQSFACGQPKVFQLPSIKQLLYGDLSSCRTNHNTKQEETNGYHPVMQGQTCHQPFSTCSTKCMPLQLHETSPQVTYSKPQLEVKRLEHQVRIMESLVKKQAKVIEDLENEKKRKLKEIERQLESQPKKLKQTKSNSFIFKTCLLENKDNSEEETSILDDLNNHTVTWKNETFVLIDAFKNRNKILNYFIPLYQSQFPNKKCKLVLSSEEYRKLFKENSHRSQSERKHAWRISIFTLDFYNFVKNQM